MLADHGNSLANRNRLLLSIDYLPETVALRHTRQYSTKLHHRFDSWMFLSCLPDFYQPITFFEWVRVWSVFQCLLAKSCRGTNTAPDEVRSFGSLRHGQFWTQSDYSQEPVVLTTFRCGVQSRRRYLSMIRLGGGIEWSAKLKSIQWRNCRSSHFSALFYILHSRRSALM